MSSKNIGRIIGVMLLMQIAGLIVPFALLQPAVGTEFLVNAAANSVQVKTAVFLLFANCALTIALSVMFFSFFRQKNPVITILPLALSVLMFALQAVDNAHLMSMLSLSQEYIRAGSPAEIFQTLSVIVRSTRRWVHYSELLIIDSWILALYALLYSHILVPRPLAVFGVITVFFHFMGITLPLLLEVGSVTVMGVAMALSHITLGFWLIAKGFDERNQPNG